MVDFFKKYKIGSFITLAVLSTLFFMDRWNIYYGIFSDKPDWYFYIRYGQSTIFFGVFLVVYFLYLRSINSPLVYNKSQTAALMFFVPMIGFLILFYFEIYIPKMVLLGIYFIFLAILFFLYIKYYNDLLPKDPFKEKVFSKESLKIEVLIVLITYIFFILLINEYTLIGFSILLLFSSIYHFFFIRKGKKTYLDEYFNNTLRYVLLIVGFGLLLNSEMGTIKITAIYWILVLIYFFFARSRFIESLSSQKN